jgi:hypothetical protein
MSYSRGCNIHTQAVTAGDIKNNNLLDKAGANFGSDYVEILLQSF